MRLGARLPATDTHELADALLAGPVAVAALRARSGHSAVRAACTDLLATLTSDTDRAAFAAALLTRWGVAASMPRVDVVWSGPADLMAGHARLTSATIVDLIGQARTKLLIVGYAVHDEPSVTHALHAAVSRGVRLTLLLERAVDNPGFTGRGPAFAALDARRLAWPGAARPPGGALHAKILVVDEAKVLIGSANLTGAALARNLECGLVVDGGPVPASIWADVEQLLAGRTLIRLSTGET